MGAYAVVAMIAGYGLLAFRDTYGIRPLVVGANTTEQGTEYLVASESVALDTLGFKFLRDIAPGKPCSSISTATSTVSNVPKTRHSIPASLSMSIWLARTR